MDKRGVPEHSVPPTAGLLVIELLSLNHYMSCSRNVCAFAFSRGRGIPCPKAYCFSD